jgi:hypothetical protein
LTCLCLMAGVPTAMTSLHDLQTKFFYIMTSQRDNTMRLRRRATLEYVKRIDATRYIAPCICHTIRHIHGNDVPPLREVWYVIFSCYFVHFLPRISVIIAVIIKNTAFRDMALRSVKNRKQCFGGVFCLLLQKWRMRTECFSAMTVSSDKIRGYQLINFLL